MQNVLKTKWWKKVNLEVERGYLAIINCTKEQSDIVKLWDLPVVSLRDDVTFGIHQLFVFVLKFHYRCTCTQLNSSLPYIFFINYFYAKSAIIDPTNVSFKKYRSTRCYKTNISSLPNCHYKKFSISFFSNFSLPVVSSPRLGTMTNFFIMASQVCGKFVCTTKMISHINTQLVDISHGNEENERENVSW